MRFLVDLVSMVLGIGLLAASLLYVIQPRRATDLLKRLAWSAAGLVMGAAVLQKLVTELPRAAGELAGLALLASPVAYAVWRARRRGGSRAERRGAEERKPAPLLHLPEVEE